MEFILIILVIGMVLFFADLPFNRKVKNYNRDRKTYKTPYNNTEHKFHYNYNYMPFAKGNLLTKTEHEFFIILVREALKRRLLVCPKVRLEDIIYVTEKKFRDNYRGYIKSRHVDFVLIDKA